MTARCFTTCTSAPTRRATSASGGSTRPAAASGSRPSATPRATRCCESAAPASWPVPRPSRTPLLHRRPRVADSRLASRQGELIDRSQQVTFTWQGLEVTGYAGDTIASALFGSGTRVFSRSFKYHRRRGLMCCSGQCPNCLVNVDGEPTVRACMTPVQEGMTVSHLNAWPSLNRDFLHLVGRLTPGFGMQVGFYYKTF